jgi:nitrate reductase NapD
MTETTPHFHVAGIVVQAMPHRAEDLARRIAVLSGATVHAVGPTGKLVVTLESERDAGIVDALTELQRLDGVVSALLVSEHHEPLAAADEDLTHAPSPPHPA